MFKILSNLFLPDLKKIFKNARSFVHFSKFCQFHPAFLPDVPREGTYRIHPCGKSHCNYCI